MTAEKIRSFIAIELTDDVINALTRVRDRLKKADEKNVKWVEPENMHLTLQFLGNIDTAIIGNIAAAIEKASAVSRHFQLEVGGLGAFPDHQRVQTIWVGLGGDIDKLTRLQKDIGANLTPLGFPPETRPFSPHLTLGRARDFIRPEERETLGRLLESMPFNARYQIDVTAVNLMKSQLTRQGPIYTKLAALALK